jgi:hypothetical protein
MRREVPRTNAPTETVVAVRNIKTHEIVPARCRITSSWTTEQDTWFLALDRPNSAAPLGGAKHSMGRLRSIDRRGRPAGTQESAVLCRREPQRHERLLSAAVILCVEVLSASAVESDDGARCSELLERSSWRRIDHDEVSDEIRRSARLEVFAERIDHVPPDLDRPPTGRIVGVIGFIESDSDANEAPPSLDGEGYDAQ